MLSWRRWPGRLLLGLATLALAWTSLAWWLPGLLRPRIEAAATQALGTPVQLHGLALSPWTLRIQADGLQIGAPAAPLFKLAQVQTQLSLSSLWHRAPVLRSLRLQAPQLWVQRLAAERYNFSPLLDHLRQQPASPGPSEPARFALHNIELVDGQVIYDDQLLHQQHRLEALQVGLPFLSNLPSDIHTEVRPQLSARIDGSELQLSGQAEPFGPDLPATLQLDWHGLKLVDWAPLLAAVLPPEQAPKIGSGTLSAQLRIAFKDPSGPTPAQLAITGKVGVQDLQAELQTLGLQARWQRLQLEGLDLAPLAGRYALQRVHLQGLEAQYTHAASGAATAPASAASTPAPASTSAPAPGPQFKLAEFQCSACTLRYLDRSTQPEAQLTLQQIQLKLGPLSQDLSQPIAIDLAAQLGGPLSLKGQLTPQPLQLQADLALNAVDLRAAQPYLAPHLNLRLAGGQASAAGHLDLAQNKTLQLRYQGRASVAALKTQDSVNGADFLAWQQLAFDGLDIGLRGEQLDANLGRIRLDGLQARVILHPDAHLNFADIPKRNTGAAPVSVTTPQAKGDSRPAPTAQAQAPAGPAPRLRWQQLAISQGTVYFTDNFIRPNYSAKLTQLKGEVSALSSEKPEPARLNLSGALDDGAPLRISGRLHPLGARLYTDIDATARGIALTRLSAYAERYAGYRIDKGTLTMTVHYKIDQGKLEAENQLFLDQFTFGDKVDSPDATSLPVRLAVALLKNSKGEIDIRLPIGGTLDDPQFSVGSLVWRALVNLLTRVATAPFALLSGGGDSDSSSLNQVSFAAGSADLSEAAQKSLDKLAQSLKERPGLKLEITGHADPGVDLPPPAPAAAASGAAKPPAGAASAPGAVDPAVLKSLADARADRVLSYLAGQMEAERLLLVRSVIAPAATDAAGVGVVLGLR